MNGHKVIHDRLNQFTGLTDLVGTRIYPLVMPDKPQYPAVTFHVIASSSEKGSTSDPAMMKCIVQVTAWDKTLLGARTVADQIRKALDRYRNVTLNGVKVDDCIFEGDQDLYDPEPKIFYVPVTFRLHFRES